MTALFSEDFTMKLLLFVKEYDKMTLSKRQRRIFMKKRLYKSAVNKKLCGVCGGIAEYFDLDPTIIRLAWVVFTLLGGSGIIAYIIAALVMPSENI